MIYDVRYGDSIRSTANIAFEAPLPGGAQLVVFRDRKGDLHPYIFNGEDAVGAMSAALGIVETLV